MKSELTKTITERNRYRDLLYKRVIDDEIARTHQARATSHRRG